MAASGETNAADPSGDTASGAVGDQAAARTAVREIEVDRTRAVTVVFADGTTAVFDLLGLRRACPCAGCRGRREVGRSSYEGDTATVVDAELHGNWAISLRWQDGHDTGMYAWSYLRELADGAALAADGADPVIQSP